MLSTYDYVITCTLDFDPETTLEEVSATDSAHDIPSIWGVAKRGVEALVAARVQWIRDGDFCRFEKVVIGTESLRAARLMLVSRLTTTKDILRDNRALRCLDETNNIKASAFAVDSVQHRLRDIALGSVQTAPCEINAPLPSSSQLGTKDPSGLFDPIRKLLDDGPCILQKFTLSDADTEPFNYREDLLPYQNYPDFHPDDTIEVPKRLCAAVYDPNTRPTPNTSIQTTSGSLALLPPDESSLGSFRSLDGNADDWLSGDSSADTGSFELCLSASLSFDA